MRRDGDGWSALALLGLLDGLSVLLLPSRHRSSSVLVLLGGIAPLAWVWLPSPQQELGLLQPVQRLHSRL